jgi:hypothetical protein
MRISIAGLGCIGATACLQMAEFEFETASCTVTLDCAWLVAAGVGLMALATRSIDLRWKWNTDDEK